MAALYESDEGRAYRHRIADFFDVLTGIPLCLADGPSAFLSPVALLRQSGNERRRRAGILSRGILRNCCPRKISSLSIALSGRCWAAIQMPLGW